MIGRERPISDVQNRSLLATRGHLLAIRMRLCLKEEFFYVEARFQELPKLLFSSRKRVSMLTKPAQECLR